MNVKLIKCVLIVLSLSLFSFVSCSSKSPGPVERTVLTPSYLAADENPPPGVVTEAWVEPMYDTVKVPAQLDPAGNYFRPAHRTIVEIRPDRFQQVQYEDFPLSERYPVDSDKNQRVK